MKLPCVIARVALAILLAVSPSWSCTWDYPIWIPRSPTADPLYRFLKYDGRSRKMGYIDRTGKVVIPAVLSHFGGNSGHEFRDGLLVMGVADGVYVNTKGEKVIDRGLYRGWDFADGLAVAMEREGGPWGYINSKGEFAITPRFASYPNGAVSPFHEGLARIEVTEYVGYIDKKGEFAIRPRFLGGDFFHDGMARVVVEGPCVYVREDEPCGIFSAKTLPTRTKYSASHPDCKYTFIDKYGNIISDQRFDDALPFSEGLAPVKLGKLWGYIDKKGTMVIPPRFEKAAPFSDGLARVSQDELYGFIDRTGTSAIQPTFKFVEDFTEGFAVVFENQPASSRDQQWVYWYIDHNGRRAFPDKFSAASPFFKGLAHVEFLDAKAPYGHSSKYAYIDRAGKVVFTYEP